jgi:hypothetical protein
MSHRALLYWLSTNPPVLYTHGLLTSALDELPQAWKDLPATHIWMPESALSPAEMTTEFRTLSEQLPNWNHRIAVSEARRFRNPAPYWIRFHDQLLVSPEAWPLKSQPKYYDAVLNAPAVPWMRHHLAARIPRLLVVIHGSEESSPEATHRYANKLQTETLSKAYIAIHGEEVPPSLANWFHSQSKVGLALSEYGGGERTVGEYQLSGIPVISTMHTGGRCELTDPYHMAIVPSNPDVIADTVRMMIARAIPAAEIRETFLQKLSAFRMDVEAKLGCTIQWPKVPMLEREPVSEAQLPGALQG